MSGFSGAGAAAVEEEDEVVGGGGDRSCESWSLLLLLVESSLSAAAAAANAAAWLMRDEEVLWWPLPKMGFIEAVFEGPPFADRFIGFGELPTDAAGAALREVVLVGVVHGELLKLLLLFRKWCC